MKDNKDVRIEIRMTAEEKQSIQNYAKEHNTTVSKLVRLALDNIMIIQEGKKENV